MMTSQFSSSWELCQSKVAGCPKISLNAQCASWSQLLPGKVITPNFIALSPEGDAPSVTNSAPTKTKEPVLRPALHRFTKSLYFGPLSSSAGGGGGGACPSLPGWSKCLRRNS